MKVERVRATNETTRDIELDDFVPFNSENASFREQILCSTRTAHNLQQDGYSRRDENLVINAEPEAGFIESKGEIERDIGTVRCRLPRSTGVR